MLWLGRGEGEGIVLPTAGVEIRIGPTRKRRVRVGVSAPAEVPVMRAELLGRVEAKRAGSAAYRVLWFDPLWLRVGISSEGPYWTAVQAAERLRSQTQLAEVLFDCAELIELAHRMEPRDLSAIAAGSCGGSAGKTMEGSRAAWRAAIEKYGIGSR